MNEPKRHHWWPECQSKYWADASGLLYATRSDGTNFRSSPENIGVEGQLYTRFGPDGSRDVAIETWFGREVEDPFASIFDGLIALDNIQRTPFRPDPHKRQVVENLGYVTQDYREHTSITAKERKIVADYVAALVVRNPFYLERILKFHQENNQAPDKNTGKTITLENMLYVFGIYRDVILRSDFMLVVREDSHEFLFSDSGITVTEPWRAEPIPFDIHFPLTPSIALNVLPGPPAVRWSSENIEIMRARNAGIDRSNRLALGSARRFVFSHSPVPGDYIEKYFGKPAPSPYGYRFVDGKMEFKYDASRDI
ncbi:MAG TPA: DUF4238 domain-containing protein [Steroidobacteraceae bacterium]